MYIVRFSFKSSLYKEAPTFVFRHALKSVIIPVQFRRSAEGDGAFTSSHSLWCMAGQHLFHQSLFWPFLKECKPGSASSQGIVCCLQHVATIFSAMPAARQPYHVSPVVWSGGRSHMLPSLMRAMALDLLRLWSEEALTEECFFNKFISKSTSCKSQDDIRSSAASCMIEYIGATIIQCLCTCSFVICLEQGRYVLNKASAGFWSAVHLWCHTLETGLCINVQSSVLWIWIFNSILHLEAGVPNANYTPNTVMPMPLMFLNIACRDALH